MKLKIPNPTEAAYGRTVAKLLKEFLVAAQSEGNSLGLHPGVSLSIVISQMLHTYVKSVDICKDSQLDALQVLNVTVKVARYTDSMIEGGAL